MKINLLTFDLKYVIIEIYYENEDDDDFVEWIAEFMWGRYLIFDSFSIYDVRPDDYECPYYQWSSDDDLQLLTGMIVSSISEMKQDASLIDGKVPFIFEVLPQR